MVTRDDVARLAGTSTAVVSYVVNNGPRNVSDQTRQRVLQAISELGYQPNGVARALRASKSNIFGLIVPDLANPYFAQLTGQMETHAYERGYMTILANSRRDAAREAGYLRSFLRYQVDGIVLIGVEARAGAAAAAMKEIRAAGTPRVFLDRRKLGRQEFAVLSANENGGYLATQHLLQHGYASIGTLTGPPHLAPSIDRRAGWQRALTEHGLAPDTQLNVSTRFSQSEAFDVMSRLIADDQAPRALFVHSDAQAIGVLMAAAKYGLRVPDELAVIGFDDIENAAMSQPALTTIRQPITGLAKAAIDALVDANTADRQPRHGSVVIDVDLVIRESCGCRSTGHQL